MADDKPAKKTEEQQKELDEAVKDLNAVIGKNRPKNVVDGTTAGVGNIVGGAVGAVGVVVLMPTLGLAVGTKQGGILGGILGVTGGVVVGAVGAVGVATVGLFSGVGKMVRGVIATPQAMIAPMQGKWWNENEGKWIKTNLPKDYEKIKDLPEDDVDILGDATKEVEEAAAASVTATSEVNDMYYYDVLDVGPEAEPSAIKRKYYVLARKYHPDKVGKDDKEAADKFKDIAEAYQVLSDPDLRKQYDKEGRDGLSADKTGIAQTAPTLDPAMLFAFLFGSDQFSDFIGRLAAATSASIGDSPKISPGQARELQSRRVLRLAVKLAERLSTWTDSADDEAKEACKIAWKTEAEELSMASFGIQLVRLIGQAYSLCAVQFLGSVESGVGMPSISKWAKSKGAKFEEKRKDRKLNMQKLTAGFEMMGKQSEIAKKISKAETEEEKLELQQMLEEAMSHTLLKILWTTTAVDITSTIHETAQLALFDLAVDKETRKSRGKGLKELGDIFMECPEPPMAEGEEEKDARKLNEEAAFAAMLETIKRKEEAANSVTTA